MCGSTITTRSILAKRTKASTKRSYSPRHSTPHQPSRSSHRWSHTSRRGNQHREGSDLFPLDNGKFQRRVLSLLADIREKMSQVGHNYEPPDSQFHLEKMNSRRELKNLKWPLADEVKKNMMMSRLVKIGGAVLEDCVKNMMKRVLTNRMMAMMNMDGTGPKKAFGKTRPALSNHNWCCTAVQPSTIRGKELSPVCSQQIWGYGTPKGSDSH
ncbi:hypothetical protein UPYG_G00263580 [Umbra pygmaea]|uniref:Uncharacterized protein n=1 Tax=Umbra pygmaea TaxID=75934 RepID=A0ABD0WE88_UMBPY